MSEYPTDYPQAPQGSSLDLVFRAMHAHGFEFGDGEDWQCPLHVDDTPSCGIRAGDRKAVLVSCQKCISRLESSALFAVMFCDALGIDRELLDDDPAGAERSRLLNPGERQKMGASKRSRRRVGTVEATYEYDDAEGQPVVRVDRMRDVETDKKFFRQFTFTPEGWLLGIREGTERPVYQLPFVRDVIETTAEFSDDDCPVVFFVEGEKSVQRIGAEGGVATCVAGGSNVTDPVLHSAIAKMAGVRFVTIIADRDHSGYAFALRAAREFATLTPKPKISVARSLTEGEADDVVEHLEAGHGLHELEWLLPKQLRALAEGTTFGRSVVDKDRTPHRTVTSSTGDDGLLRHEPGTRESIEADPKHWPKPDAPLEIAELFYRRYYRLSDFADARGLLHWNGDFFEWDRNLSRWLLVEEAALRSLVYEVLGKGRYWHTKADGTSSWVPVKPTPMIVSSVLDALRAVAHLGNKVGVNEWLDGRPKTQGRYVHFRNGHLAVGKEGVESLTAPTPLMFNHNALPFEYEPEGDKPMEWARFLKSIWPDDNTALRLLQEWFGYVISGDTSFQKMLFLVGPPRSGKGTISRVLTDLMGPEQVASPTLHSIGANFGLASLIGKPLGIIADARFSGRNATEVVERLLSISGEDSLDIDRKNREAWIGRLPTRLMLSSNETPSLHESSGAFASRVLMLSMVHSFVGREDRALLGRLSAEYPAIIRWGLAGLSRLVARGYFTVSKTAEQAQDELRGLSSPVASFALETCLTGEQADESGVLCSDLYELFRLYSRDLGVERIPDSARFGRDLRAAIPTVERVRVRVGKVLVWHYRGISITREARRSILGQ